MVVVVATAGGSPASRSVSGADQVGASTKFGERYGDTYRLPTVLGPAVVTGDPEGIRAIFTADPETFVPYRPDVTSPLVGETSLILVSGARHRREHLDSLLYATMAERRREPAERDDILSLMLHDREDLYPEPTVFRPSRFLDRKLSPFEHIPFGGGARRCIGAAFALYEMKIVLATILRSRRRRPRAGRPELP